MDKAIEVKSMHAVHAGKEAEKEEEFNAESSQSELNEKEKKIVVPGELLTDKKKRLGEHVYLREGKIFSDSLGFVSESEAFISVVPLQGVYTPRAGDVVVGIISDEKHNGYLVDINSFYANFILKSSRGPVLKLNAVVSAKVFKVSELNEADLGQVRQFYGGEILRVSPVKVPRIIGKNNSMLEVLRNGTNSNIMVGRNGYVWIKDGNAALAVKAIKKIEMEAHLSNLTNRINDFLIENKEVNK
ncbi:MAG TPA: KH domain-containing protein [archaeon]|nr:KH domain-containing protein [archaeon]